MDQGSDRWRVLSSRPIYSSPWVGIEMVDVVLPSGVRREHHAVTMPSAAMTVVFNDEGSAILLSWRHRFVPDVWNWELPGGIVDGTETPERAAEREVVEETGYRPSNVEHVVTFEPMVGMVTSPHHVFVSHGAERIADPIERDEGRFEWVPIDKASQLVANGQVRNSGTLIGLLYCLAIGHRQDLDEPPPLSG